VNNLTDQARTLLAQQSQSWDLLRRNLEDVAKVESRGFDFGKFIVNAQFNPSRLGSVSAKVDEESIRNRQCFLCDRNRPAQQASLACGRGYKMLCNPFPIVPEHFTIVHESHRPQRIMDCILDMLAFAQELGERFTVFYNGPQCGASAPDHLHLQAGAHGFMPVDREYDQIKQPLGEHNGVRSFACESYLRQVIGFESMRREALESAFAEFHDRYHQFQPRTSEPLMNVLCNHRDGVWRLIIFPRHKHRPSFFFADDHTRIMVSPGAVDMAGIVVMPVQAEFERLTSGHLAQMYEQVTVPAELFAKILPFRKSAI
jgi:hypothetical protein